VELEQVLNCLADGARQTLQADAAAVRLLDKEGEQASVAAISGLPGASEEYRSTLSVPLVYEDDSLGVLHVYAVDPGRFDEQDAALLTPMADLGASAIAATRALMALENREASKSHFIQVATHELRSPVAVAQSLMRGVLKGYAGELTDKQNEVFSRISRRLDFLENLVNDLLDLAAGKASELAEEETAVAINASVGRAMLLIQPRAEEKEVALTLQPCCEELVAWGAEEGLDRIFVNLIGNAVKYTPSGGSVTVALRRVGEEIQVEVADTGIGIPAEALPHLFEEFYRAPNAKALNAVGTGLGLSIVQDLVNRYGGRIEVESKVEEGSTFTVTLPILVDW
jgi:two-component system phosphate regulon sensor histidine kinase PhoR